VVIPGGIPNYLETLQFDRLEDGLGKFSLNLTIRKLPAGMNLFKENYRSYVTLVTVVV
jgi:hypothetical protein